MSHRFRDCFEINTGFDGNDGISMQVFDIILDFDNMTYTQSYKDIYNTVSGSFTSIKIGDTTINASQMTSN